MATTPTTEPARIIAGDTLRWTKTLADYPATDGWVLSYVLVNATGKIIITASASGADHAVNVPASTTDGWAAGSYDWRARVSKSGDVFTVGSGRVDVVASLNANAADLRSNARKILEAVEAAILGTATANMLEYEIAGRRLKRYSIAELLKLRDRMSLEVRAEDAALAAANGTTGNDLATGRGRVYVRFGA